MFILQAFILWVIVSTLIIGGAMIFHRLYPEESPWFGFIVPPLAVVIFFNFIEHLVALPSLLFLLPVALVGLVTGLWLRRRATRTDPRRAAYVMWGGWAVVCGCGLAVLLIGLASTSGWARATARRTRELLIASPEEGNVRDRDSAPVR